MEKKKAKKLLELGCLSKENHSIVLQIESLKPLEDKLSVVVNFTDNWGRGKITKSETIEMSYEKFLEGQNDFFVDDLKLNHY